MRAGGRRLPVLPRHAPGLRIGLLGGSFNPPHQGHLMISRAALARLGLDALWWIVTPGNPLKSRDGLQALPERLQMARALAQDPRIHVTGFEAEAGLRFTFETLRYLSRRCKAARFVWIMGADNLAGFHHWQRWQGIAGLAPIAVIDRPGATLRAMQSPAAAFLRARRIPEHAARALAAKSPPAWLFIHGRRSVLSSTALRQAAAAKKPRGGS